MFFFQNTSRHNRTAQIINKKPEPDNRFTCPARTWCLKPAPVRILKRDAVEHGETDTFIISRSGSDYMHNVVSSRKMENGIVVFWEDKGEKTYESFNYSELVDMKINALDLLERPKSYKVDKEAHTLVVKK